MNNLQITSLELPLASPKQVCLFLCIFRGFSVLCSNYTILGIIFLFSKKIVPYYWCSVADLYWKIRDGLVNGDTQKKNCSYGLIITWFTKKTWSAGGTPEGIVIKVENNLDHRSRKSPKPQFLPARGFFFNTSPVNSLRLGFKSGPAGCYSEALAARLEDLSHHHMIYSC